jgi:hypothetical protein
MVDVLSADTPEFRFIYERYTNMAFLRRGLIINETIMLERLIDDFIIEHFCKDQEKQKELRELIIATNRMIFENKIQVLKVLLERHHKYVLEANPKLTSEILEKIIPERNVFAHYWLVTSAEIVEYLKEGKTVFVKFKNTTEHLQYDDDKVREIMMLIAKYIKVFMTLQNSQPA